MAHDSKKKPSLATLARYAAGDCGTMTSWKRYVENDPEAKARVSLLKKLHRLLASSEFTTALPAARRLAGEIFDNFQAGRTTTGTAARLYFDSAAVPLPEGMRPSRMSERRLKYTTGSRDIELSVTPSYPGRFDITGRFRGEFTAFPDVVRLTGRSSHRAGTDGYGFFSFTAVTPGTYTLRCESSGEKLVITDLRLQ